MSPISRWFMPIAVALALATPVAAQWKPHVDAAPYGNVLAATTPAQDFRGMSGGAVPAVEESAPTFIVPPLPGVERTSRDVALMIVGGAALILGAVIGDDAGAFIMVGGTVVGLVGLYQYLR